MTKVLGARYEFRCDGMIGRGAGNHLTILNRIVCCKEDTGCVTSEADPRHAEIIIRQLGLEGAKCVSTPPEKKRSGDVLASLFRSLVMRAQCLAQDQADLSECVKSLTRKMKAPNESDVKDLKRLGRYLVGNPRVVNVYYPQ